MNRGISLLPFRCIDEELFDVIAGFEALNVKEK